jgi:hypothetical protein
MLNAFCRVAPSVRLSALAILPAGVFFFAIDFNVHPSSAQGMGRERKGNGRLSAGRAGGAGQRREHPWRIAARLG